MNAVKPHAFQRQLWLGCMTARMLRRPCSNLAENVEIDHVAMSEIVGLSACFCSQNGRGVSGFAGS
jgi:hypothetical protein